LADSTSAPTSTATGPAGVAGPAVAGPAAAGTTISAAQVADVKRQLDLFLSPGDRYDDLIKAVIIDVDGKPVVEHYGKNGGPDVTGNVYSVTKSVMSALIGIAIDEGLIAGVDSTLGELLPEYKDVILPEVAAVTLEEILTMTGGIIGDDNLGRLPDSDDWIGTILSTPLEQPAGTVWSYATFGSHLLSAVLVQATGRPVLDYAREKLFDPLGIDTEPVGELKAYAGDVENWPQGFAWAKDPTGLHFGGSDIALTPLDLVTFGRMYLDGGRWNGKQVVPAEWVAASTTRQVDTGNSALPGYGYQWRVLEAAGHPAFAAVGRAGQLIEVVPDLRLVVVVACKDDPAAFDAVAFSQFVAGSIIPALS
jgi:CubicO group peptidase (beta-lactamase class C family)